MHFRTVLLLLTGQVAASSLWSIPLQNPLALEDTMAPVCDCTGIEETSKNNTWHICNNSTLGPQVLPWHFPMLSLVNNYDRFGGKTPLEFLKQWRFFNETKKRMEWRYPEQYGFQLDDNGIPIKGNVTLPVGVKLDRFGGEGGNFVSSADAPFSQRALPPDSLNVCPPNANATNCSPKDHPWNYRVYNVTKPLLVEAGPIASGFGQPGGGAQFMLGQSIEVLVKDGYLTRLNLSDISIGPGNSGRCGRNPANCFCSKPT